MVTWSMVDMIGQVNMMDRWICGLNIFHVGFARM